MRFIPTIVHGLLDYLVGILLVIAPFLFWTTEMKADMWIPIIVGGATIIYSAWTDYEWGGFRTISMRTHLLLDFIGGVLLAVSPWLFGFADVVYLPFLIIGIFEIIASLLSKTEPKKRNLLGTETV